MQPFRVGEWEVVPSGNHLQRGSETVRLGPTIMQVLVTLAARPGELVTREELLEAVWNGTFVTDEVLSNAVYELRQALGDDVKSPRYIKTVPKKGYQLVAPVEGSNSFESRTVARKWLAVPAIVSISMALWWMWPDAPLPLPEPVRITALDGRERAPALSPDGRRIAFFTQFALHVVSTAGGDPLLLSSVGEDGYLGHAAWSPDGEWIAFSRWRINDTLAKELRMVRALGGSERPIAETLGHGNEIDWSPDGAWLAGIGRESRDQPDAIYLYSPDTGEKRRLSSPPGDIENAGDRQPRFSPDGRHIAFLRLDPALLEADASIYLQASTGSGEARRITSAQVRFNSFDWLPDGSGFLASARDRLFYVPLDSGELVPLGVTENVRDVWTEGDRLVYRSGSQDTDIWRIPGPNAGPEAEMVPWITSRAQEVLPQYSPDGRRVVFTSDRSGSWEIWVCEAEASNRDCRQLTFFGESAGAASWSPDGRQLAFLRDFRSPTPRLYVMDAEGGVPEPLIPEAAVTASPFWSDDGTTLYFGVGLEEPPELWKISLPSRQASKIDARGRRPQPSTDGRFLYYSKWSAASPIARIALAGGDEEIVLEKRPGHFDWDLWEDRLVYMLWTLPYAIEMLDIDTRQTTSLFTLPVDYTPQMGLTVSPDGRWILLTREEDEWDVMLLENYLSAIPRSHRGTR